MVDALVEADTAWNGRISQAIWDPKRFSALDDTILKRIEYPDADGADAGAALAKAQGIVRRIRTRDLYSFVNESTVPHDRVVEFESRGAKLTPEDIVAHQHMDGAPKPPSPGNPFPRETPFLRKPLSSGTPFPQEIPF